MTPLPAGCADTGKALVVVRDAALEDRQEIWEWWNDPVTRKMMKKTDSVPWEEHCAWFDGVLKDPHRVLCVGSVDGQKIGNVRFDAQGDDVYEVSINLNPAWRGQGYGAKLLQASIEHLQSTRAVSKLIGGMKKINLPSRRTFEKVGFVITEPNDAYPRVRGRFSPEEEWYVEWVLSPLAIHGGEPVRKRPMPARLALGPGEVDEVMAALAYYRGCEQDLPYQGVVEQRLCEAFAEFMGGGYADAVATGTGAIYVALAALDLPKGSEVILSPVTASSPLSCIVLQGLVPVVADSRPDSYNMGVEQFLERVTPRTSAVLAVHLGGEPLEMDRLVAEASRRGIKVLEDCSQAPGAVWKGQRVGSFGDIAALSTMYRKNLISGSSGGLVFTRDRELYRKALAHADHGKPTWRTDLNLKDPRHALFPALNFNTNELSCAIALASLRRLQETIDKRLAFLERFISELQATSRACRPSTFHHGFSPFFFPVLVETERLTCSKVEFAQAVRAEGVSLDPEYGCVVRSWEWALPHLSDDFETVNALAMRDRSFNLFLNERYGEEELRDILAAIKKVERHVVKG